jgi:DNA-binding MarR family transcriptional regulator
VEDPNDRRRAIVSLTSEGQRILDQITHANRRHLQSLEGDLFRDSLRQSLHLYSEAPSAVSGDGSAAQAAMSSDAG